jgi:hypothetical protein
MAESRPARALGAVSVTAAVVALALVAGAAGAVWLDARRSAEEDVVVATRDVDGFGVISAVELRSVPRRDVPRDAVTSVADARDRYALDAVAAGDVLTGGDVGPRVTGRAEKVVLGLPLDAESSAELAGGQFVDVLIAPSVATVRPVVLRRVLVVDVRGTGDDDRVAFVAVPRVREREIAGAAARGKVLVAARS